MSFRVFSFIAISATGLLMSACSPMNSEFSCNATAGDSCMTIEQVDAMTRFSDGAQAQNAQPSAQHNKGHTYVWVAPQSELVAAQNHTLITRG